MTISFHFHERSGQTFQFLRNHIHSRSQPVFTRNRGPGRNSSGAGFLRTSGDGGLHCLRRRETILVTGVGAWAEYGLLWLILLSVLVKGITVTYLLGRFTAVSGQPFGRVMAKLPGPRDGSS